MDPRGARELAKRIAEERRRTAAAGETPAPDTGAGGDADASGGGDADGDAALDRLQEEVASLRTELAAREDAIERLRMELGELRTKMIALSEKRQDEAPPRERPASHVLFVSGPNSYGLLMRDGRVPEVGSVIALDDEAEGRYRVCKIGPSPLPGDRRRCAFLERLA